MQYYCKLGVYYLHAKSASIPPRPSLPKFATKASLVAKISTTGLLIYPQGDVDRPHELGDSGHRGQRHALERAGARSHAAIPRGRAGASSRGYRGHVR